MGLFILIIFYLFKIFKNEYYNKKEITIKRFILALPLIVYGLDALLNFPVARPLMQSSFAIYLGLDFSHLLQIMKKGNQFFIVLN